MKNTLLTALAIMFAFFIGLAIYTTLAGPIPFRVQSITTAKSDSFTVMGEGKVSLKPDTAYVRAGVNANAATVKQAQDQMNKTINQIAQAMKKLGVEEKDIQTENYNINPSYDYRTGSSRITGYTANTNLLIKVRNLDKANEVIDTATANGATQIGGITFDVEDKEKAQNEARQKAVAEAKRKAQDAAKIAGFRLGNIINYQENMGGNPMIYQARPMALDAAGEKSAPTQVEPGTQEVAITVSLSYEIR